MAKSAKGLTFRPDTVMGAVNTPHGVIMGKSGVSELGPNEARVSCPKCGSPHVVQFGEGEPKYGAEVPSFKCQAGDCKFEGAAVRRVA